MDGFGPTILKARKAKGYSQRELAKLVGLDFTYLSKLENDRADYPPKEDVIRKIATELDINAEELVFLAGRIPEKDEAVLKQHYQAMPALFRRMKESPEFAERILSFATDKTQELPEDQKKQKSSEDQTDISSNSDQNQSSGQLEMLFSSEQDL
jgi:HTH-type transcriptional regulator, competence development regulator